MSETAENHAPAPANGNRSGTDRSRLPVFVVDCHRSGTNLLYDMLLSAGGFAIYRGYLPIHKMLIPRFGHPGNPANRKKIVETFMRSKGFARTELNARDLSSKLLAGGQTGGDFLRIIMDEIAQRQGVIRWAVYDPDDVLHIPRIIADMPNALFVHIIRDGRDGLNNKVLLVLLYPTTLMLAQSASGRTLWGMAEHRTLAWVSLAEGVANLVLSGILVRPYGIMGDAVGTAIPLTCSMILFLPHHLCHLLKIRLRTYLDRAFVLPLVFCLPLVAVLLLMQRWFVPHRLSQLLIQLMIAGLVYGMGLAWAFRNHRAWDVGVLGANHEDEVTIALVETYQEKV